VEGSYYVIRAAMVSAMLLAGASTSATAQVTRWRWQPEARVEALAARTTALHAAVGANAVVGTYARLALLGAGGARRADDEWVASGRVEAVVRFHVDPLRQFAWGAYAGGGGALFFDDGADARVRALIVVGYEGPAAGGGWIGGVEVGVGGGARIAFTARRVRDGAR
jgi:hypothetical protein